MKPHILIIHGLNQKKIEFWKFLKEFKGEYGIYYFHYSNKQTIPEIVENLQEFMKDIKIFHVVTMSLGAIIFRNYIAQYGTQKVSRVVMVGPPNQGAELLRKAVRDWKWRRLLGKLAQDFVEHEKEYLPEKPEFELGVIAGTKPKILIPPVLISYAKKYFDPADSDGKVKIAETKLPFMKDFVTVDECHDLLIQNSKVIELVRRFLERGSFRNIPTFLRMLE